VGDVTQFDDIDESGDPEYFARFLTRAGSSPGAQKARSVALERLRLQPGQRVLDAGCGLGRDVADLAQIVGSTGRVVGIDASQTMITRAQSSLAVQDLGVDFLVGDARRLPFEVSTFDACRAGSLLICLPDPEAALAELVRVVRPGGRVVVLDSDNDTLFIDSPYAEVTRTVVHSLTDGEYNGAIGRRLPRLFREQGLAEVEVWTDVVLIDFEMTRLLLEGIVAQATQAGSLTSDEAAQWWGSLRKADAAGTYTAGKTLFVVSGHKPAEGHGVPLPE
jgi:ubiquinone/menaquinone biosynthesis C-methylase UbiE